MFVYSKPWAAKLPILKFQKKKNFFNAKLVNTTFRQMTT